MQTATGRAAVSVIGSVLIGLGMALPVRAATEISVLEKDGQAWTNPTPPPPYVALLQQHGIRIGFPETRLREVLPVSPEYLRQFNVVVVPTLRGWTAEPGQSDAFTEQLHQYMTEGGGVLLFNLAFLEGIELHQRTNQWLKRYGAQFLWEVIRDKEHEYTDPPAVPWQYAKFLWTTNIPDTPLTQGVQAIYYADIYFRGPHMVPLEVGPDWTVLVRPEPTAQTFPLTDSAADAYVSLVKDAPGRPAGARALLAVRQVGRGRLAVFGGNPASYWFDLGKPVHAGVIQERGDGVRRSDWIPLLVNTLRWLSEPARTAGKPGGFQGRVRFQVRPDWGNRTPIDWEKIDREGVSPAVVEQTLTWHSGIRPEDWKEWEAGAYRPWKVLIGPRPALAGGKGTVADWKVAAQKAGYHAVIFRVPILDLTPAQWQAFVDECRQASDERFLAIPGMAFVDWIGNHFMRFGRGLKYPLKERLTPDGKRVKDQLANFFDMGWPCNFPYRLKDNPTPFWNYRVYDAWPVAEYEAGQRVGDHVAAWEELVQNYEYPSPLVLHLLDSPEEAARAAGQMNTYMMAKALADIAGPERLYGSHNNPRIFSSDGPIIDRFHALNMYRTTLGSRGVAGSHRYRVYVKAHSDRPLRRVELWGDGQCLRRYRPAAPQAAYVIDELHDRARGLLLRVEDEAGRVALSTGIMVHDKMMWFVWCGDHCNALPCALGLDPDGNPGMLGIGTRVKSSFQGMDGPGTNGYDMWRFVPWGTDTSSPATGLLGDPRLVTTEGLVPSGRWQYTSRVNALLSTRDCLVQQLVAAWMVDREEYRPHMPAINGWYPYTRHVDTDAFTVLHEDLDLHRDVADPMFQYCSGTFTFKKPVTLKDAGNDLNVPLCFMNFNHRPSEAYGPAGRLPVGTALLTLKAGQYVTWPSIWGNVTVYSLDGQLAARVSYDGKHAHPYFGYALAGRSFKPGDTLAYRFLILRWPMGVPLADRLDAKMAVTLNLAGGEPAYSVTARQGKVLGTQFFLDVEAERGGFAGSVAKAVLGSRLPVRVRGLNPNWTAAVWRPGVKDQLLVPISPRRDGGPAVTLLDVQNEFGDLYIGHVVGSDAPDLIVRVLQRSDGRFDVLVHNPREEAVAATLTGCAGAPLAGWRQAVQLAPGEEKRLTGLGAP